VGPFGGNFPSSGVTDKKHAPLTLIPYLRVTVKYHKEGRKMRYITSNVRGSLNSSALNIHPQVALVPDTRTRTCVEIDHGGRRREPVCVPYGT
jgi:hypothetical protein